jgi:predicted N-formylglutamate amidohydrolase
LAEAFDHCERSSGFFFESALHRLRGEFAEQRAASDASAVAEACYREALALSQRQDARLHEVCAAAELKRLLIDSGRQAEADDLIAEMPEGFHSALGPL